MMSTERRASALAPSLNAASPRASNDAAVPRDMQRNAPDASSSAKSPNSPDRKRPRYEPALSRPAQDDMRSRTIDDEDEMDELDESNEVKRVRGESDDAIHDRKPSGTDIASRPSSAAAHHAHWTNRSASAAVESRFQSQHQQHPQPRHRDPPTDSRRYDYDRPMPSRYDGPAASRDDARHAGGLPGERYAGEHDRDPRDRMPFDAKQEHGSAALRMPPPNSGEPGMGYRNRAVSPPPRLPGFASLEPDMPAHRSRDEASLAAPYSGSPRRSMPFHPPSYASYPPPPHSRTPLMHHPSPTPSTSYGNPPMIHPSLAGLPGAGGGPGGKQQPSFVSKLYSMLEDASISDLISWGASGTVFSVANPAEFSRLVLPNWFKHSNWQSFVRQLNMYGFHKVNHSYQGNPTDEVQVWEFRHPSFRRGEIALLNDIKRKSSRQKRAGSPRGSIGGADLRADRSGGSSTPSPEVPLATIPGGPDGMRGMGPGAAAVGMPMGPGGHRGGRDFAYGDERMDPHYADRRPDVRGGYGPERGYPAGPADEYGYMRPKMDGPPGGMPNPAGHPAGAAMGPGFAGDSARRGEPYVERAEAMARFEDLSERTDAIIRHASFLESQIRILSDQLADSRAYTVQVVRDEMVQMLDRLERALTAPAQPGTDPTERMLDAVRAQLAFYMRGPGGPADRGAKQVQPSAAPKRPSV